ncbi:UDP-glucose 4-epimerase GalE (plasmid) [Chromobacterium amazonense]|uniref:UDP-glucose 4-epimerase GalE n=1 Tax=Chromobacterium amazonense TaxID=1382803 RepID=UPI00237ECE01|nr:UDP-glucose 4-epimerase GalE [Chromobacterium amazonense]MDE1713179.1 UDP-glucose 4-epimerase GalE [Chromobacterium amazonense]
MAILVTGGAGYIGSHTCLQLLEAGYDVVVLDNLCNSKAESLKRVQALAGKPLAFLQGDIRNTASLSRAFAHPIEAVIHFAGLKAVSESVEKPLEYYDNNVNGSLQLLQAMRQHHVQTLVFSSSATAYGNLATVPIREDFPLSAINPYGRSKLMVEDMLRDFSKAEPNWNIALLRYFNPVGAHASGQIGEDPNGVPNNLMPFISQVATGKRKVLQIFGNDSPPPDGTGVHDNIHVVNLAKGHLNALDALHAKGGLLTVNLGTGQGYSVLDMVRAFEAHSARAIPYEISPRRPGDIAECWAASSEAERLLGWKAEKRIDAMYRDSWNWQSKNPNGF